jgi:hypothetical protein
MERTLQTNPRTQPALRAAYPASLAILAAAAEAARDAHKIVADFRAQHAVDDCNMEALTAAARRAPFLEWSEERCDAFDLDFSKFKNSPGYDLARAGDLRGVRS